MGLYKYLSFSYFLILFFFEKKTKLWKYNLCKLTRYIQIFTGQLIRVIKRIYLEQSIYLYTQNAVYNYIPTTKYALQTTFINLYFKLSMSLYILQTKYNIYFDLSRASAFKFLTQIIVYYTNFGHGKLQLILHGILNNSIYLLYVSITG